MNSQNIKDYEELIEKSNEDLEWFWNEMAQEMEWFGQYNQVLDWKPPHAQMVFGWKVQYSAQCAG